MTKPIGYVGAAEYAAQYQGDRQALIIGSVQPSEDRDAVVLGVGYMDATDPDAPAQFYGLLRLTPADRDRLIRELNEAVA